MSTGQGVDADLDEHGHGQLLPSTHAHRVFQTIKERWSALEAWGLREKLPHVQFQADELTMFCEEGIRSIADVLRLRVAAADLTVVERYARKRGYPEQLRIKFAGWEALLVLRAADTEHKRDEGST